MSNNPKEENLLVNSVANRRSATRAIKNAKHLQNIAPHIMPKTEPAEGYGSIIPFDVLSQLHKSDKPKGIDKQMAKLLEDIQFPNISNTAVDPLFKGKLYFVRIQFTIQNQNNAIISVSQTDVTTALQYATLAVYPISAYASQYGTNSMTVHQSVIQYAVSLPSASYNGTQLQSWVNDIVTINNLPSNSCVIVLNPMGMTNTNGNRASGIGGYHSMASIPYCFVNMYGQNLTVADANFSYAFILSHEIAEMVVDPLANDVNPEVCDGCAGNCGNFFASYFDSNGYIDTLQSFPPAVPYTFYINSIVQPAFAIGCPTNPNQACNYAPPRHFNPVFSAHERTAAWIIELWLLIHGGDPGPIDILQINKNISSLSTIRAIAALAKCLENPTVEKSILQALRPLMHEVAGQLHEEL